MLRPEIRAVAVITLILAPRLGAQCADGSAPPCRGAAASSAAARAVPIDANRIAVLPLRVTTADSLLGEGFAELLAPEFTGDGSPRAVDMSTTLAAWRRAGGGHRSPLSLENAARLARSLGAGKFVQGSVVGSGTRLTVVASVYYATSASTAGAPARASNVADSLDALVMQVASALLGNNLERRVREAAHLTRVPAALRSYIEGLALMRRGNFDAASAAFEASIAADSTFASPAYQRWMIASELMQPSNWGARVAALKSRLPQRERSIFEAQRPDTSRRRTARQALDERRRLAESLNDSPEMWYLYGDQVFHSLRDVIPADSIQPLAAEAFARAIALDTAVLFLHHNLTVALALYDTASAHRMARTYAASGAPGTWALAWIGASAVNDAQMLGRLRRPTAPMVFTADLSPGSILALNIPAPVAVLDEGFRLIDASAEGSARDAIAVFRWMFHRARGRPNAAEQSVKGNSPPFWRAPLFTWYWATGDTADDEIMLRVHGADPLADSVSDTRRLCLKARLLAARGQFDSVHTESLRRPEGARCAQVLEVWREFKNNTLTNARLAALDTVVARGDWSNFLGFEHRLLASIYEARRDTARALWALRLYPRDFSGAWLAPTYREEGRLYLLNRDTTRAVASYRRYLELRAEAEPLHVAERDSISALVSRIARRR